MTVCPILRFLALASRSFRSDAANRTPILRQKRPAANPWSAGICCEQAITPRPRALILVNSRAGTHGNWKHVLRAFRATELELTTRPQVGRASCRERGGQAV